MPDDSPTTSDTTVAATDAAGEEQQPQISEDQGPQEISIPDSLPVLATGPNVMYPAIVIPYVSAEERDTRAIDEAVSAGNRLLGIFAQTQAADGSYTGPIQAVGTAVTILRMARVQGGAVQALLQGVARVCAVEVVQDQPSLRVRVERIEDIVEQSTELEALARTAVDLFQRIAALTPTVPQELVGALAGIPNPGSLADFIAANMNLKPEQRQEVLAEPNVTARLRLLTDFLGHELSIAEVGSQIQSQVKGEWTSASATSFFANNSRRFKRSSARVTNRNSRRCVKSSTRPTCHQKRERKPIANSSASRPCSRRHRSIRSRGRTLNGSAICLGTNRP